MDLTLRQFYAGLAMLGILADGPIKERDEDNESFRKRIAWAAYQQAQAMVDVGMEIANAFDPRSRIRQGGGGASATVGGQDAGPARPVEEGAPSPQVGPGRIDQT